MLCTLSHLHLTHSQTALENCATCKKAFWIIVCWSGNGNFKLKDRFESIFLLKIPGPKFDKVRYCHIWTYEFHGCNHTFDFLLLIFCIGILRRRCFWPHIQKLSMSARSGWIRVLVISLFIHGIEVKP